MAHALGSHIGWLEWLQIKLIRWRCILHVREGSILKKGRRSVVSCAAETVKVTSPGW